MDASILFVSGRSATVCLKDGGLYHTHRKYALTLNGKPWGEAGDDILPL